MEKFKKDDYIVSLKTLPIYGKKEVYRKKGQMFRVPKTNIHDDCVYYQVGSSKLVNRHEGHSDSFRMATEEEIVFFKEEHSLDTNIRHVGVSFDEKSKYKAGDRVKVKRGLRKYMDFGTFCYPEGVDYVGGEELTVKRVTKKGDYIMKEKGIRLKENLIENKVEIEFVMEEQPKKKFNFESLTKGEYYRFEHINDSNKFSIVKHKEFYITPHSLETKDKFGEWVNLSFSNKGWRARIKKASEIEIEWLNFCIDKNKFRSRSIFNHYRHVMIKQRYSSREPKQFPTHGWCPNPSKELISYISEKFNKGKAVEVGKRGFAWQSATKGFYSQDYSSSVWKIERSSSYSMYYSEQLEDFLPKTVCIDLEAGGLTWQSSSYVEGWESMVAAIDPALVGINASRQGVNKSSLRLRDYQIEKMDRMKEELYEAKMRQAMFSSYPGDYILASTMAMQALGRTTRKKQDEFTQQDVVLVKTKKKKRKLISS